MAAQQPGNHVDSMLRDIDGLTVDLDGTLVDLGPAKARLWWHALRAPRVLLGWSSALERTRRQRHRDPRAVAVRLLAAELSLPVARVDAIIHAAIDLHFPRLVAHAKLLQGTLDLVEAARARGLPVAVVSDYPALEKLDALDLTFDIVVDCRALGALKPHPDGLLTAARLFGVAPCRLLHVGDRWDTDGLAAAAAGVRFVPVQALR